MRLADFIEENSELILSEWVTFAKSCGPAGSTMDLTALRDHALEMLSTIVADLRTPQSEAQRVEKGKGNAAADDDAADSPAEVHGAGRAESGFTVGEMVAEYRALRASVIRLWTRAKGTLTGGDLDDLLRFNEAIDQALAESITRYTMDVDHSKEMFLAILGHDLRSPLGAITMASQFMLDTGELQEPHLTLTARTALSAQRMSRMVGELLDFTRSRLGNGVPVTRAEMDLGRELANVVSETMAAHPDAVIQVDRSGDLHGSWDCARLTQMLTNLLANAVQHGTPRSPIRVSARGEAKDVVIEVRNRGVTIPPADLQGIFGPFKRLSGPRSADPAGSLGLGLYIVERIVTAHGGTITVSSSDDVGTAFTVHLPRTAGA